MKIKLHSKNWMTLGLVLLVAAQLDSQVITKTYLPTSSLIANPERGWYDDYYSFGNHLTGNYRPVDSVTLRTKRENDKITLVLRLFYLHQFLDQDTVSNDYLDKMQADFDAMRTAGVKCIVRFAYSDSQSAAIWDATPDKVLSHIESLSGVLSANSDIIAVVQAGFIGAWGEWYYTTNFAGSGYVPDETDIANRRAVVEALLNSLPENIQVQVRTPAIKKYIVQNEESISDAEAYDGSVKSRVAHHNDCFLANSSDYGTYVHLDADLAYMAQDTKYAIAGGETCDASNVYSDCVNAIPRMQLLHWTYLNREYNQDVYKKWENQGCLHDVDLALGYRIYLTTAQLPDSVIPGNELNIVLNLKNVGFAAPTQYKPIQVVLTRTINSEQTILDYSGSNSDIRYWFPGDIALSGKIQIPNTLKPGHYTVSLLLHDQSLTLENNPAYSIQFANVGLWDAQTGVNNLNQILVVGDGGEDQGMLPGAPLNLVAATDSYSQINLSWSDNDDETGYEIYRSVNEEDDWFYLATLEMNTTLYSDEDVAQSTTYSYLIRAFNGFGNSDWSASAKATTLSNGVLDAKREPVIIYPNPWFTGELSINSEAGKPMSVEITDASGKQIFNGETSSGTLSVNGDKFLSGLYLVIVKTENSGYCKKLIVK